MSSLCEQYTSASAADQRAFAETARNDEQTVAEAVQFLNSACAGNGALTLSEAIGQAVADEIIEEAEGSADPYADTRIHGRLAAEIARSIKESWNRCDENDVCIPGEAALAVGRQPDPQVKELSCFVTTERGAGGEDSGYPVHATVGADSYSWRLDRG